MPPGVPVIAARPPWRAYRRARVVAAARRARCVRPHVRGPRYTRRVPRADPAVRWSRGGCPRAPQACAPPARRSIATRAGFETPACGAHGRRTSRHTGASPNRHGPPPATRVVRRAAGRRLDGCHRRAVQAPEAARVHERPTVAAIAAAVRSSRCAVPVAAWAWPARRGSARPWQRAPCAAGAPRWPAGPRRRPGGAWCRHAPWREANRGA